MVRPSTNPMIVHESDGDSNLPDVEWETEMRRAALMIQLSFRKAIMYFLPVETPIGQHN